MRKSMLSLLMVALMLGFGAGSARGAEKDAGDRLSDRAHEVNNAAKKSDKTKAALHGISVETGVPLEQVEAMHKHYSDVGVAGVLIACVLADETKKPPENFMKERQSGKGWTTMARNNKVSVEKINERLDHLERILTAETDKAHREKRK